MVVSGPGDGGRGAGDDAAVQLHGLALVAEGRLRPDHEAWCGLTAVCVEEKLSLELQTGFYHVYCLFQMDVPAL